MELISIEGLPQLANSELAAIETEAGFRGWELHPSRTLLVLPVEFLYE
jgi:hypothetical protein